MRRGERRIAVDAAFLHIGFQQSVSARGRFHDDVASLGIFLQAEVADQVMVARAADAHEAMRRRTNSAERRSGK